GRVEAFLLLRGQRLPVRLDGGLLDPGPGLLVAPPLLGLGGLAPGPPLRLPPPVAFRRGLEALGGGIILPDGVHQVARGALPDPAIALLDQPVEDRELGL